MGLDAHCAQVSGKLWFACVTFWMGIQHFWMGIELVFKGESGVSSKPWTETVAHVLVAESIESKDSLYSSLPSVWVLLGFVLHSSTAGELQPLSCSCASRLGTRTHVGLLLKILGEVWGWRVGFFTPAFLLCHPSCQRVLLWEQAWQNRHYISLQLED